MSGRAGASTKAQWMTRELVTFCALEAGEAVEAVDARKVLLGSPRAE
jgi:hypothetical protein